jgi:hypothetical protein
VSAEKTERTYEWSALADYQRSNENLQIIGAELEGVVEELEQLQVMDQLPETVKVDDTIQKIREAQASIEDAKLQTLMRHKAFKEAVMKRELH